MMAEVEYSSSGEESPCSGKVQKCSQERGILKGECVYLTQAQLLKREQLALIKNTDDLKHSVLLSMIKILTDAGYTEFAAGELANQCLTPSPAVCKVPNKPYEPIERQDLAKCIAFEKCSNAGKSFRDIFDTAHLILNAPCGDKEEAFRHQQATNYMQAFLGGSLTLARKEKNEDMCIVVRSYQEMKDALTSFFSCLGTNAIRVYIIFNGHGSEEGLCLDDEGQPIPIALFTSDIQKELATIKKQWTSDSINIREQLPKETIVVLAQCHSHLYGPETSSDAFRVVPLSTPENPCTYYCNIYGIYSYHQELNAFAEQEREKFRDSVTAELVQCSKQSSLQGEHINEYRNTQISIAFIGKTNSGKSSLINAIRDLTADDLGSADVDVTPGPIPEIKHYPFPGYDQASLADIPGLDCLNKSKDEYLKMINMDDKNVIVICTANVLTDHDVWLTGEAERRKKQYYLVRTHIDATLAGQEDQHPRTFNKQNVLESIQVLIQRQLDEKNLHPLGVYLISNRPRERAAFDLPRFKSDLLLKIQSI